MDVQRNFSELQRKIFDLTLALYRVTDFFPKGEVLRKSLREKANEIFSRVTEYTYGDLNSNGAVAILGRIEAIKGYLEIARSLKLVRPINIAVLEREYQFFADFFDPVRDLVNIKTPSENNSAIKRAPIGINSFRISNGVDHELEVNRHEEAVPKNIEKNPSKITPETLPTWEEFVPTDEVLAAGPKEKKEKSESANIHIDAKKEEKTYIGGFTGISDVISDRQKKIVEHLKGSSQAKISDFYTAFNNVSSKTIQRDLQDLVGKNILKKDGEKRWTVYSLSNV